MLFFSFVVAPVTFTALNEENARKFIRKIFPYYYNVNLGISIIVTLIFIFIESFHLDFFFNIIGNSIICVIKLRINAFNK